MTYTPFPPRAYLEEYYSSVGPENLFLLEKFHDFYSSLPDQQSLIELGGGPTIYQLLSASAKVGEITFTDLVEDNLREVRAWKSKDASSFSWRPFSSRVSGLEQQFDPTVLEDRLRAKIKNIIPLDVLAEKMDSMLYDIVSSHFFAESVTNSEKQFMLLLRNLIHFCRPGGFLLITALENAHSFIVQGKEYTKTFPIAAGSFQGLLGHFGARIISVDRLDAERQRGYSGILVFVATRN